MLKELSKDFNNIEQDNRMKETLIEIKNNLQGVNIRVDEAKNQISGLECKKARNGLKVDPRWQKNK